MKGNDRLIGYTATWGQPSFPLPCQSLPRGGGAAASCCPSRRKGCLRPGLSPAPLRTSTFQPVLAFLHVTGEIAHSVEEAEASPACRSPAGHLAFSPSIPFAGFFNLHYVTVFIGRSEILRGIDRRKYQTIYLSPIVLSLRQGLLVAQAVLELCPM